MKQFPVTHIYTTDDGRVILSGPRGSIDISRRSQHSTVRAYRSQFTPPSVEEARAEGVHTLEIRELPNRKELTATGGWTMAF